MKPFEPAPPAKGMKVRLKHNEFRDLVNELRDTADRYGGTDQLRDQLSHTLARRVRPVPDIVKMRPVLERIDARLACDVLSASSTVEVLRLARDEIMVLTEEVMELRAALQHEADCVEAARAEVEVLRAELAGLRSSMEFRTSLIGRTEAERDALRAAVRHEADCVATAKAEIDDLRAKLEATEEDRSRFLVEMGRLCAQCDALRAKIAEMEKQRPAAWCATDETGTVVEALMAKLEAAEKERDFAKTEIARLHDDIRELTDERVLDEEDRERIVARLQGTSTKPALSVPKCPYPCGWRTLLKYAIEDGAYLARSINEDEPVTENARAVTMRTVMRLRDVLMAINKAAPEESK